MRTEFLCVSVLRVASGPRVKLASCKSALNPRWFTLLTVLRRWSRCYSYSLLLCGLFYEAICCMSFRVSFCSCVFSPFSIAITSLGEERANLSVFRTFVRFVLVWICRFPLPLGVWEGLRFVVVAPPGLFFYLFFLQNGQERMIAYFSKTINKAQRQYCVIRRELLAIEEAAKFFRQYLWCLIHCQNRLWWCSVVKKFQESILNSCKTVGSPEHI